MKQRLKNGKKNTTNSTQTTIFLKHNRQYHLYINITKKLNTASKKAVFKTKPPIKIWDFLKKQVLFFIIAMVAIIFNFVILAYAWTTIIQFILNTKFNNKTTYSDNVAVANPKYKGSAAFFAAQGADEAVQIVLGKHKNTPKWYRNAVKLGEVDDATSLENMKKSLELIKTANKYRIKEAQETHKTIPLLKITDAAMAMAQINADQARYIIAHPELDRIVDGAYVSAENLAFSTGYFSAQGAVKDWYSEKVCHIAPKSSDCEEVKELNLDKAHPTGHYDSLVNPQYTITGAAISSGGSKHDYTYTQEYYGYYQPFGNPDLSKCESKGGTSYSCPMEAYSSYSTQQQDVKVYTVEEYEKLLNKYLSKIGY